MNEQIQIGLLRGLMAGILLGAVAFLATYNVTDTECRDSITMEEDGTTTIIEEECTGWKPVIVATGQAFLGPLVAFVGYGAIDSRNKIQVVADQEKRHGGEA